MRKLVPVMILVFLAILVYSKLDWWVAVMQNNWSWSALLRYWAWQNAFWMLFGLTVSFTYWAGAKPSRETTIICIMIFVTFGLVLISNLLDWAYFWFNTHAFPPIEQKWTWMPQSWMFGQDWGSIEQMRWTLAWLLAIPLAWYIVLKWILPTYGR